MNEINIKEIVFAKNPLFLNRFPKFIKNLFFSVIERMIHLNKINRFLEKNNDIRNFHFIDEILEFLDYSYTVSKKDRDRIPSEGKLICIANHPLGGLDGIVLLKLISEIRKDVKIIVNDLLLNIDNLRDLFLPYNIYSNKSQKENIVAIQKAIQNEECIIVFPAGEVSRVGLFGLSDSKWNKGFLAFAEKYDVPIQPIFVKARNSFFFYFISALNKRLSSLLLINELFNKRNKVASIHIGNPIPIKNISMYFTKDKTKIKLVKKHLFMIGKNKYELFRTEKCVVHPLSRKELRKEITNGELLGKTADGKSIYFLNYSDFPVSMQEISRLREITFRKVGEGTGAKKDTDKYDQLYNHIVLWDENEMEIVGSYRIGICKSLLSTGGINSLYTSTLFNLSDCFVKLLPESLELGRSFVQSKYWNSMALDYLWLGIGAYLARHPEIKYLFGGVSLSNTYTQEAKDLIIYFYKKWFGNSGGMVSAKNPYLLSTKKQEELYYLFSSEDFRAELKFLKERLKYYGFSIPTLYKQYSDLCTENGVQFLDCGIDSDFQNCVDGFIVVSVDKIKSTKRDRYINSHKMQYQPVFVC